MFSDEEREMDGILFDEFGRKAVYNDAVIVGVILEFDVMRSDGAGGSIRNHYEFTVSNGVVGKLSHGDTFDIGRDRYRITEIVESDDSITIGAAVRES